MTDRDRETLEQWASELECNLPSTTESVRYAQAWTRLNALRSLLGRLEAADQSAVKAIGDAYAKLNRAEEDNERLRAERDELRQRVDAAEKWEQTDWEARIEMALALIDKLCLDGCLDQHGAFQLVKALKGEGE